MLIQTRLLTLTQMLMCLPDPEALVDADSDARLCLLILKPMYLLDSLTHLLMLIQKLMCLLTRGTC